MNRPDDWGYAKNYLNALCNLRTTDGAELFNKLVGEAIEFFRKLQNEHPKLYGLHISA